MLVLDLRQGYDAHAVTRALDAWYDQQIAKATTDTERALYAEGKAELHHAHATLGMLERSLGLSLR